MMRARIVSVLTARLAVARCLIITQAFAGFARFCGVSEEVSEELELPSTAL